MVEDDAVALDAGANPRNSPARLKGSPRLSSSERTYADGGGRDDTGVVAGRL
jgi:hypothetical protein